MKTKALKDIDQALELATKNGEITLQAENGERFTLKHNVQSKPVDIAELRKYRVKMPGITSDELVESVHEMRAAGY